MFWSFDKGNKYKTAEIKKYGENATAIDKAKANLATRKAKSDNIDRKAILSSWDQLIKDHNQALSVPDRKELSLSATKAAKEAVDFAIKGLSERNSVFSHQKLTETSLGARIAKTNDKEVRLHIQKLLKKGDLLSSE